MSDTPTDSFEGPGKGKAFFDRARTVAESGNYDYAIDMYIEGLNREPENIPMHEALRDVSLRRKMKGGKSAGGMFGAKTPLKGKAPKDNMLNSEWLLAKDPGNISEMLKMIRAAVMADYLEIALWFAPIVASANETTKQPKMEVFTELIELLENLPLLGDKKIEALRRALKVLLSAKKLKPDDMEVQSMEKDLAAKILIAQSYEGKEKDFKESLRSQEGTKQLLEEDSLIKSDKYKLKLVEDARIAYEANPKEHQLISKYGKALADTEMEEYEEKAIDIYIKGYQITQTYRYKSLADDVRMKQVQRTLRMLNDALKADPDDATTQAQHKQVAKDRLALELEVFTERVKTYPTDASFQFELAKRLYLAKRFDEAIQAFQFSQNNPKYRAESLHLLGRCFEEQGMKQEATETLKRAIEEYEYAETGDSRSKEYHYRLARVYEDVGREKEAMEIYSKVMQWDFSFKDVRTRLEALRKKV